MDYLAKLHWEALVQQKLDPTSAKTKEAIEKFNRELDKQLAVIFKVTDRK